MLLGLLWFLSHCVAFSFISILTKSLLSSYSIFQILFIELSLALIVLVPFQKGKRPIIGASLIKHSFRSLLWLAAMSCFFISLNYMVVADAMALSFSLPVFATILSVFFLGEKLALPRILSLLFGLIGMVIIINPGPSTIGMASLLVFASAFCFASTDVILKRFGKRESPLEMVSYFVMTSCAWLIPVMPFSWVTPNMSDVPVFIILSFLFIWNIAALSRAYQLAELSLLMPFKFTLLIFSSILAYFWFDEHITISTIIGSVIILLSTSYMAYRERVKYRNRLKPEATS